MGLTGDSRNIYWCLFGLLYLKEYVRRDTAFLDNEVNTNLDQGDISLGLVVPRLTDTSQDNCLCQSLCLMFVHINQPIAS